MQLSYTAPPICGQFMQSASFGRLIAGPVGSGKTTACIFELLRRACEQPPGEDGIRYTRFAIARQTLRQLKDTVVKDVKSWLGPLGEWRISESTFYLKFGDVHSEWFFIPLEDETDQARLLSMQLTGAWLSEAIEMDISVVAPISGRCGRYPSGKQGNPSWFGMIADTNMPSEGSAWHRFMEEPNPEWSIHRQPSGLSQDAENLSYLTQTEETIKLPVDDPKRIAQGRSYYERFVNLYGIDSDWVRRYVKAEYGEDPSGAAVFRSSFHFNFHVVEDTNIITGYPLIIGQDFGRDPCSVLCQVDHMGRLVVHEEVMAKDIGLEVHVNRNLRPVLLGQKYLGMRYAIVGDPAGRQRSAISEESCFDALKRMGLPAFPAPTNEIDPRLRAVEAFLLRQANGGPAILFNKKKCPVLVRAMNGGYRYTKNKEGVRKPKPDKNEYSHIADALQYVALIAHGGSIDYITQRILPPRKIERKRITSAAWT